MIAYSTWIEVKLLVREPLVLVVTLMFPILLMVLLLISFTDDVAPDPIYGGLGAIDFYVTSYLGAAIAAMGFMGMPTHLASYRSSGVLRRFRAGGLSSATLLLTQVALMAMLSVIGAAAMLALAYAGFELATPASVVGVVAGFAVGICAFAGIGALLGTVMPSARAAQGLGLLLFFGTFFLAGGGPPPGLLPDALNDIAGLTPIGFLIEAIRTPWADGGLDVVATAVLAAIAIAGFGLAGRRLART